MTCAACPSLLQLCIMVDGRSSVMLVNQEEGTLTCTFDGLALLFV